MQMQKKLNGGNMSENSFDEFKRELKTKCDIVSIVSKYLQLDRRGRYYWCRCPFHGDKNPSMCVNDIDNTFYCYGCHAGGDVIQFVMQIESQSFIDAVKTLANWANMEVPASFEKSNGEDIVKAKKRKDKLLQLMKDAARHYYENLSKKNAEVAREYIKKRQISDQVARRFGLGFADGYSGLPDYLKSLGYSEEEMLSAGVVKRKDNRVFDPFANRLIFPIIDIYGNVIAFGGRTLDPKSDFAKYLNTAETEIFNKRNTLYAINYLKKQRQVGPVPYVIIVEGYMDTISLHKAGFTMTVASMGTALTQTQAKLIKRFSDKVYICYDGDSAGQNATLRGLDILKNNGLNVFVVQLPDRFDPDDVIKTYGGRGFQKILDEALPLVEFKLNFAKSKYDLSAVDGRVKYLNEAIEVLAAISSGVERELYIPMVADTAMTNADFIRRELDKKLSGDDIGTDISASFSKAPKRQVQTNIESEENGIIVKSEKYVLYAMVHEMPFVNFKSDIGYLFSGERRQIYYVIISAKRSQTSGTLPNNVYEMYSGDDKGVIADIINFGAACADDGNEKKYFNDCLWNIYENYLKNSLADLIAEHSSEVDIVKRQALGEKMKEIQLKLKLKKVEDL